jgi:hypothetical protein
MLQEIRISGGYCRSDIIMIDMTNYNLGHAPEISLTNVKKYKLCALIDALVIRTLLTEISKFPHLFYQKFVPTVPS